ncbi:unnamed protein product, partial [Mesorhabditis spiculigera]
MAAFEPIQAKIEDLEEIIDFLYSDFFKNDPLTVMKVPREMSEEMTRGVVTKGEMVALRSATIRTRDEPTYIKIDKESEAQHIFFQFNRKIFAKISLWDILPKEIERVLWISLISVRLDYTRKGLAKRLVTFDQDAWKEQGLQSACAIAAAIKSQKLFTGLGFNVLAEVLHEDIVSDEDGTRIVQCIDGTDRHQCLKDPLEINTHLFHRADLGTNPGLSYRKAVIELFYDVISPYSWIQFEALSRYAKVWPVELKLKPFYLGGVMKAAGNRPPMTVPAKGVYMLKDLQQNNRYWGTHLNTPSNFAEIVMGKTTIQAQRMLAAVAEVEPEKLEETSRELWRRIWSRGESIFEADDFQQTAKTVGIKNTKRVFELMKDEKIKKTISSNVEKAVESGAFGAPWTIVTLPNGESETFFGSDRMHLIADYIGVPFEGPLKQHAAKL